jgi:uncharacterized membrane protein YsdA (DUF1294 family)
VPLAFVLLVYLALVNVVTFFAYARDKRAARTGARRTPERTLFALNLAGGFVGGWLGMRILRHKTRHLSFKVVQTLATLAWVGLILLLVLDGLIP